MDKVDFLGEIKSLCIHGGMTGDYIESGGSQAEADGYRKWITAQIFDPRQLLLENIPFEFIDLKTLISSLKIEYLHIDYDLPSLLQIPQSKLESLSDRRDSTIGKQVKTANFKREFNSLTEYAAEIKLVKGFITSVPLPLPDQSGRTRISDDWQYLLKSINYDNTQLRVKYPFANTYHDPLAAWRDSRLEVGTQFFMTRFYDLGGTDVPTTYRNFPINEYLYNGGLPGFLDLMPYLIKNGNLIFNGLNQAVYIATDICKLGGSSTPNYPIDNQMIINGGYSGTAQFKERERKIIHDQSKSINNPLITTKILNETDKRALIFLTNNTTKKLYFSFSNLLNTSGGDGCPYLNPGGSFTWEHGDIVNLDGFQGRLKTYDKRAIFGLPLWVKSEFGSTGTVACEQYVYDY